MRIGANRASNARTRGASRRSNTPRGSCCRSRTRAASFMFIPMRGRADVVARHCGLIASHAHHCDKQGAGVAANEECCSDPPESYHRMLCSAPRRLNRAPWQRRVAGLRGKASHVVRDLHDDSRVRAFAPNSRERLANVGRDAIRVVECLCAENAVRRRRAQQRFGALHVFTHSARGVARGYFVVLIVRRPRFSLSRSPERRFSAR